MKTANTNPKSPESSDLDIQELLLLLRELPESPERDLIVQQLFARAAIEGLGREEGNSVARIVNASPQDRDLLIRELLVARESSVGSAAEILLAHLFYTIVAGSKYRGTDLPDFGDIVDIYNNPDGANVEVFRKKGMKAVLIKGQHDVLLSLASARKLTEEGDNAFVTTLIEILDTGDYDRVVSTSISRLCRNTILSGSLEQVLRRHRIVVLIAGQELKVWEPMGQLLWTILVWFSSYEAQQIESRLIAGKIARAEKGEWSLGYLPPPGWRLDEKKNVEVDPDTADAVRWLIQQVIAGQSNWTALGRRAIAKWPDLEARRGGGLLSAGQAGTHLRRSWLNEAWFGAYVDEVYKGRFIPHEDQRDLAQAIELQEQRRWNEAEEHPTVRFALPSQPTPIATREDIETVKLLLADRKESRAPTRRIADCFGGSLTWYGKDVTIEVDSAGADRAGEAA